MKYLARPILIFGSLCFLTSGTFARTTASANQPQVHASLSTQPITCSATIGPVGGTVPAVPPPAAPYSAVRQFSNVQTLADGRHISSKVTSEKIFRDSQNRTRSERPFCSGNLDDPAAMIVTIRDPVSGYAFILDSQNHIAYRYVMQIQKPAQATGTTKVAIDAMDEILESVQEPDGLTSVTQTLSSQTMEGLYVEGKRTTETIPKGLWDNDKAITIMEEEWYSPDLNVPILTRDFDPRHGEMTNRLTNIDRSEPSLSLFVPPPEYKVVDETGRVTITYTRH